MQTIAITIDDETLERLDALAKRGVPRNRSLLIRDAVKRYLAELERGQEEERESQILKRHRRTLARQATALMKAQAR